MIRSEQMKLYNLVMFKEAAWDIMNKIGTMDCL